MDQKARLVKQIRAKKRRSLWFQSGQLTLGESVNSVVVMNERIRSGKFGLLEEGKPSPCPNCKCMEFNASCGFCRDWRSPDGML